MAGKRDERIEDFKSAGVESPFEGHFQRLP